MTGALPKFTVVIPLYNKGPHVARAIQSVLEQDFPPAEIIVVDDASTDRGDEIAGAFAGVQILRRSVRGPGGYAARNFGIQAAMSHWVAFLDADDRWRPDHLSSLAEAISDAGPDVGCAFTQPIFVAQDGVKPYPVSRALRTGTTQLGLPDFVAAWLDTKTCPMWTGAIAIKRSVLLAAGGFPAESASRGGDKDLWLRVMARTNAVFVPRVTAEFHQDTVNRVSHSLDYSVQPIVCRTIASLLPSVGPETRRLLEKLNNMEVAFYARFAAGAGAPFQRDALGHLRAPAFRSIITIIAMGIAGRLVRLLRGRKSRQVNAKSDDVFRPSTLAVTRFRSGLSAVSHRPNAGVSQTTSVAGQRGFAEDSEPIRRSA